MHHGLVKPFIKSHINYIIFGELAAFKAAFANKIRLVRFLWSLHYTQNEFKHSGKVIVHLEKI